MTDSTKIEEWKRIAEARLQKERHLMHLLVRHARGDLQAQTLDQLSTELDDLRNREHAAFNVAFAIGPRVDG